MLADPQTALAPDHASTAGAEDATRRETKSCPFCAEEVLAEAIVCKHCRRDIGAGPLPFSPVPGAVPTSGALYFLAAAVGVILSFVLLGAAGPFLLVVATAIWVGVDAATHRLVAYEQGLGGAGAALIGTLLLWIVVFPWYLAIRSRIRAGVQPVKRGR